MVYLCQFPCSPGLRSISPFSLKLETWFRLTGIQYTNAYTTIFSKSTKQIPYVELNGKEFADTNIIIEKFKDVFQVDPDKDLDRRQRALGHTIIRMAEFHTIQYAFYWRYGKKMPFFYEMAVGNWEQTMGLTFGFKNVQPIVSRIRAYFSGVSRLSSAEQLVQCKKDFTAFSAFLGDQDYFLGTKNPTTTDCAMFGILVQFFKMPSKCPALENTLNSSYNNLRCFVDRMQRKLWPDWNEMCSSMEYKKGEGKTFGSITPVMSPEQNREENRKDQ